MTRTTIYLPDDLHGGLKHLALERRQSMADLLRQAVEKVYKEDLKDLQAARKAWKAHLKHPGKAGRSMGKIAEPNSGDHH